LRRGKGKQLSELSIAPVYQGHERKFYSLGLLSSFPSISSTVSITDIGQVSAGTDYNNRIGRTMEIVKFKLVGQIIGGQSNLGTDEQRNTFRIALIEANAGFTASGFKNYSVLDPRLWPGMVRVLYDRSISLASPGRDTTGYMPAAKELNIAVPMHLVIKYTGTAANSDSTTSLFLLMVSDSAISPNPGFTGGSAIVEFIDL